MSIKPRAAQHCDSSSLPILRSRRLKMNHVNFFLIALIATCGILIADGRKIVNCYYDTFSDLFIEDADFSLVENMDPNLCTHICFNFYDIDAESGEINVPTSWLTHDQILHHVERTAKLKKRNPSLKIMFAVGDGAKANRIAADPALRRNFPKSALKLIEKYNIDGLNLDWGDLPHLKNPVNKNDLITLLAETHKAMKTMGKQLDVTLFSGQKVNSVVYDIPGIVKNVDFINVKTFDLNIRDSYLLDIGKRIRTLGEKNLKSDIKYWLDRGIPASKFVLSFSFYEHVFKLMDPKNLIINSQLAFNLIEGPIGEDLGWQAYLNICYNKNSYTSEWSSVYNVSYLAKGREVVFYDDAESLGLKADLINSLNLAGAMIWSIEADDFRGRCGAGKFPLLNAIKKTIADPASQ